MNRDDFIISEMRCGKYVIYSKIHDKYIFHDGYKYLLSKRISTFINESHAEDVLNDIIKGKIDW
jgi:hypothetical protein